MRITADFYARTIRPNEPCGTMGIARGVGAGGPGATNRLRMTTMPCIWLGITTNEYQFIPHGLFDSAAALKDRNPRHHRCLNWMRQVHPEPELT
jgi:hypothetical protein